MFDKEYAIYPDEELLDELHLHETSQRNHVKDILNKLLIDLDTDILACQYSEDFLKGSYSKINLGANNLVVFT